MKNSLKRFTAVLACTALTAALALPARAAEDQPIRVGSYKGTMLEVGERSGLVIGPGGSACTVTSSDPDTERRWMCGWSWYGWSMRCAGRTVWRNCLSVRP